MLRDADFALGARGTPAERPRLHMDSPALQGQRLRQRGPRQGIPPPGLRRTRRRCRVEQLEMIQMDPASAGSCCQGWESCANETCTIRSQDRSSVHSQMKMISNKRIKSRSDDLQFNLGAGIEERRAAPSELRTFPPSHGPRDMLSVMSSSLAAMIKSFSCKPLIFFVWRDTVT